MYKTVHFISSLPDLFSSVLFDSSLNDVWCLHLCFSRRPDAKFLAQVVYLEGASELETWDKKRRETKKSCFMKSVTFVGNWTLSPLGKLGASVKGTPQRCPN